MTRAWVVEKLLEAMQTGKCVTGFGNSFFLVPFKPPILSSFFEVNGDAPGRSEALEFTRLASWARDGLFKRAKLCIWATITLDELQEAIALAKSQLDELRWDLVGEEALKLQRMRAGLQIFGCRIIPGSKCKSLELSNERLPFSLRLLCCSIDAAVSLNSLHLVTLDLSGSAMQGLDATFLNASGSVRLRNAYVNAPVDFAGARINGYFDASDLVVKPFGMMPQRQAFDADRGALNLSQAEIDNDVHFDRAILFGGLSMRGFETKRSLHLDEACLLSPLGVLEALLDASKAIDLDNPPGRSYRSPAYRAGRIRALKPAFEWRNEEFVNRGQGYWQTSALARLLTDTMRQRTSALRADHITVGGSLFAVGLTGSGRVRMKHANVAGGMHMEGSNLRSAEALRRTFDHFDCLQPSSPNSDEYALCDYRLTTYKLLVPDDVRNADAMAPGMDDYALDISESRIGGNFRLGPQADATPSSAQAPTTKIDGVVVCDRANFGGEFIARRVHFQRTLRVKRTNANGSTVDQTRYLRNKWKAEKDHLKKLSSGERHALDLINTTIADHVRLEACEGLQGVNLAYSSIGGDVRMYEKVCRDGDTLKVSGNVLGLCGHVTLQSAEISGDALLVFAPNGGASIDARTATIKGKLSIMPSQKQPSVGFFSKRQWERSQRQSAKDWIRLRIAAATCSDDEWQTELNKLNTGPRIDLNGANSTLFEHPPPAWPRYGRLNVHGFKYQMAGPLGPLGPHPAWDGKGKKDLPEKILAVPVVRLAMMSICTFLAVSVGGTALAAPGFWLRSHVGMSNVVLLAAVLTASMTYLLLPIFSAPYELQSRPMAINWLQRQQPARNRYRTRVSPQSFVMWLSAWGWRKLRKMRVKPSSRWQKLGNIYHALEPYNVAVQALRAEGRWLSANRVEEERLRVRTSQLSWRMHLIPRVSYELLDWASRYGFSYARLLFANLYLIALAAMLAHSAHHASILVKAPSTEEEVVQALRQTKAQEPYNSSCQPPEQEMGVESLFFAMATVLPGVDDGEKQGWIFVEKAISKCRPGTIFNSVEQIFFGLQMLSLLSFGLLLFGISARIGSVVSRYVD